MQTIQAVGTLLVGIAAIAALLFTWLSVSATNGQLNATEQGQITDRYTAAITDLGSQSIDVRLGGIYALQRIMVDSSRDQPTVIAVLCAFVRDRTLSTLGPQKQATPQSPPLRAPSTDVQAALTVIGTRNTANDGKTTVIDIDHATLIRALLNLVHFADANLIGTSFGEADLSHADLDGANLIGAIVANSVLDGANLTRANLVGAECGGASFTGATLTSANFTGATLTGANFTGATLTHANFSGADLRSAIWPENVPVPRGWVRDPRSGLLKRAS